MCNLVNSCEDYRFNNKSLKDYQDKNVFSSVIYLRDLMIDSYKEIFNLSNTSDLTFKDVYTYADVVYSQKFEGNKPALPWTP